MATRTLTTTFRDERAKYHPRPKARPTEAGEYSAATVSPLYVRMASDMETMIEEIVTSCKSNPAGSWPVGHRLAVVCVYQATGCTPSMLNA